MTHTEVVNYNNNLSHMLRFASSVISSPKPINDTFLLNVHRCPKCSKVVTDIKEYLFMKDVGECGTCDHVREVNYNDRL